MRVARAIGSIGLILALMVASSRDGVTQSSGTSGTSGASDTAGASSVRQPIERYVAAHQQAIVGELVSLLSIPNVAADRQNIRKNATLLRQTLARRGFDARLLETDGNPLVYGERRVAGATRTLLFYAHYDGQPVNPPDWKQPTPFTPILRDARLEDGGREIPGLATLTTFKPDWRIYARSASDDKAPIIALCAALDALAAEHLAPTSNLRVVLDGEEEAGSPSLVPAIARYREQLTADAMLILDGPLHPSEKPTLVFGARGIVALELTVFGPKTALHSGHYGNWVPNPAMRLAQMLATFKDEAGHVKVDGFYDGLTPLSPEEQSMLDAVPDQPAQLQRLFGIAAPEDPQLSLQASLQRPSFNVRGLSSAFVGPGARTVVPDRATAAIDIRLVKETPAADMIAKVRAHLTKQGYHIVTADPDDETRAKYGRIVKLTVGAGGTNAYRTSPTLPVSKTVADALTRTFAEPPVRIRTSGGTVPIAPFIDALGFPAISVPIVNFDNNQHGENENLRLGHLSRGIVILAALLRM
jgi:acetylornithine deacetylase/succinyl-diaminopimelate desuccinylase-like protein